MAKSKSDVKQKGNEGSIPKLPALDFGYKKHSIFTVNRGFTPKGSPATKFNQATFHTQHKGGPSGSK